MARLEFRVRLFADFQRKAEKAVKEEVRESLRILEAEALRMINRNAPKGVPVFSGETKGAFQKLAEKHGIVLSKKTKASHRKRYKKRILSKWGTADPVESETSVDTKEARWSLTNLPSTFDHFETGSQPPDMVDIQKPIPWLLLKEIRERGVPKLKKRLESRLKKRLGKLIRNQVRSKS